MTGAYLMRESRIVPIHEIITDSISVHVFSPKASRPNSFRRKVSLKSRVFLGTQIEALRAAPPASPLRDVFGEQKDVFVNVFW